MKIIDYDKTLDKKKIAETAYRICNKAAFPVEYQDVYEHLFANDNLILKLLLNKKKELAGFGVFENYSIPLGDDIITMLYLSGMVIDPKYQGKNVSQDIIKDAYKQLHSDLISLRTQNIAMAKSLLNTFDDSLFMMPGNINEEILRFIRQVNPFKDIDDEGVIRECYPNQLYYNLNAIESNFGIKLQATDALGVVIEPKKERQKKLSRFNQVRR